MSTKLRIGISIGDVNGIGLEVILKTLIDNKILDYCIPVVYGHSKVASFHRKALGMNEFTFNIVNSAEQANPKRANMINCWEEDVKIDLGETNEIGGKYAFLSLKRATEDLISSKIDALVTAPLNKHNIPSEGEKFVGHTEYIQQKCKSNDVLMILMSENNARVALVTGHLPLSDVAKKISKERILSKLRILNESLKKDFWIQKPKIAVLGLNPHAGDNGLLGKEEEEIILPAIEEAKKEGILAFGTYSSDGYWGTASYKHFDATLAMYHDQGLIPFKTLFFDSGVNYTAGLPVVRTSPDHGTGLDIAGKNVASEASFREALFMAINIVKKRREHESLSSNTLKFIKLDRERE